jgi:Family of unknown function (DUF5675)
MQQKVQFHLELVRDKKYADCTFGKLYINGEYFCETLEDACRGLAQGLSIQENMARKQYGQTCIGTGTYAGVMARSTKFKRVLPLIMNVPAFTGIRIHRGNRAGDTLGCPLVGTTRDESKKMILQSKVKEEELVRMMPDGTRFTIVIRDNNERLF